MMHWERGESVEKSLLDLLEVLRGCTTRYPIDGMHKRNPTKWAQLCTCLDTLTDAQCAINAYRAIKSGTEKIELYLPIYGVLQAMILQQDALANVAAIFGMKSSPMENSCIREIRDIRNKIAGHPTEKSSKEEGVLTYHQIVQHTLCSVGFKTVEKSHNKEPKEEFINLSKVTFMNERTLSKFLVEILKHIEKTWIDTKRYSCTKLAQIISKEMIEELVNIELEMQDSRSGTERLVRHIDAICSGKREIVTALERRGCDRDTSSSIWSSIDRLKLVLHAIPVRLEIPQCEVQVSVQSYTSVWIEALCSELQDICCEIKDSVSLNSASRNRINVMCSYHIPALLAAIDGSRPVEFIPVSMESIKSTILDVALSQTSENDESPQFSHQVKRMREITGVIENCIKSERYQTHPEWKNTTTDLIIWLKFLKKFLTEVYESAVAIDSEYSSGLLPSNHGTD